MSTITATDLIEEMTKIKSRNEELRRGNQDLIREKKKLVEELGRANTERTAVQKRVEELVPLEQRLYEAERQAAALREQLSGLTQRAEAAERNAQTTSTKMFERKSEAEQAEAAAAELRKTVLELERENAQLVERVAGLEPFAVAIAELKKVL